jgi:hypothetical protein
MANQFDQTKIRIVKVTDEKLIEKAHKLDRKMFNDGSILVEELKGCMHYWLMYYADIKSPIGYMVAEECADGVIIGQRSGILSKYRGHRLQQLFIKTRHKYFGKNKTHITYVHPQTVASINNFISMGYKAYSPEKLYGGDDKLYLFYCT